MYLCGPKYFNFFSLVLRQSILLNYATQHAIPLEFGGKWRAKCLNSKFPLLYMWDAS